MMKKRTQMLQFFSFVIALGVLCLGGCGSDPEKEKPEASEPKPREIQAEILVSKEVNPDVDGRPSPIVVRLYELKTLGKFEVGDFYKLFDEYEALLGADLVASELFHLQPGDKKTVKHAISPETNYIAVAAAFRDLDQAVWRATKQLEADQFSRIEIMIEPLSLSIKSSK